MRTCKCTYMRMHAHVHAVWCTCMCTRACACTCVTHCGPSSPGLRAGATRLDEARAQASERRSSMHARGGCRQGHVHTLGRWPAQPERRRALQRVYNASVPPRRQPVPQPVDSVHAHRLVLCHTHVRRHQRRTVDSLPLSGSRQVTARQAKPSQAKSKPGQPSQAKPSQARPGQARPSQARPGQAKPSQAKPS